MAALQTRKSAGARCRPATSIAWLRLGDGESKSALNGRNLTRRSASFGLYSHALTRRQSGKSRSAPIAVRPHAASKSWPNSAPSCRARACSSWHPSASKASVRPVSVALSHVSSTRFEKSAFLVRDPRGYDLELALRKIGATRYHRPHPFQAAGPLDRRAVLGPIKAWPGNACDISSTIPASPIRADTCLFSGSLSYGAALWVDDLFQPAQCLHAG
jgi:hypothetical protein